MTFVAGTKMGRYEIRSKIGEGGMGIVYLAQDAKLNRRVALKVLPTEVATDPNRMKRFMQEAQAASALNHPNILTIYEIDEADSLPFIAAEFIDGVTLRERLKQPVLLDEVLDFAVQIASALAEAHAAGIIHRDIKPENIILRRDGVLKVVDFGLAKLTEGTSQPIDAEAATSLKTNPGTVLGTAFYMSPEQARGLQVDARTDIFSLGLMLYEMVAQRLPFSTATSADATIAILSEKELEPLGRYVPGLPAEFERIVSKALRKMRDERYQTAKDLLIDLKHLKQRLDFERQLELSVPSKTSATTVAEPQTPSGPAVGSTATATSERSLNQTLSYYPKAIVVIIVVLIVAAASTYFYFRQSSSRTINSIAVLPFVNASGNSELEYLSDGMTDSLINSLSQLPRLSVKARSSVFRYKGSDSDPQKLASELSVQAILTGRVVQRGDDLTLYLSLVDGRTGNQIWGEQYDRKLTQLVSLQTEVARDVSHKLQARLSGVDEQKLTKTYTANPEAYRLYLRGRYHLLKHTAPEIQTGMSYFRQALEVDPSYALAYTGLADAYRLLALPGEMPATELMPQAKAAAQKAVEIDDSLAEAHAFLGTIIWWYDWDWDKAENEFKRALELNPNSPDVHEAYGSLLSFGGRPDEGVAELRRARELDPLNERINTIEGSLLINASRPDEALDRLQKTVELEPNFWFAHQYMASAYIEKGMFTEAIAEARKAKEFSGVATRPTAFLGYALAKSGRRTEAEAQVSELLKLSKERYVSPYNIAMIYNGLGEREKTLEWLERGYQQREPRMVLLGAEPKWNNLHDDPQFQDLLRRIGLAKQ